MYKVFIQNNPLIFIDSNSINDFNGIFMFEQLAVSHVDYILQLMKIPNPTSKFYVIGQKPDLVMDAFFDKFEKVSAAGGIVECEGKVLLIKKNGIWDLPKGKVEDDEDLNMTALREVEEETGLKNLKTVKRIEDTFHFYDIYGKNTIKKTAWYIMTTDSLQDGTPQTEEGITELKWIEKSQLLDFMKDSYGSLQDLLNSFIKFNH